MEFLPRTLLYYMLSHGYLYHALLRHTKKGPTGKAGGSSYAPIRLFYQLRPNRRITV